MAGKIGSLAIIVLLGGFGAYLAAGYGQDDRGLSWTRRHLTVIQQQLSGLKSLLQDYRRIHSRYPTNDEGLAALDNFDARFPIPLRVRMNEQKEYTVLPEERWFWTSYKRFLRYHREQAARAPANAEEFSLVGGTWFNWPWRPDVEARFIEIEVGITRDDDLYLLSDAGVLSPWQIPYVYENRNGLDSSAFADSPADRDPDRYFSVAVDDGVYVYSVGGEHYLARLRRQWWDLNVPRFIGAGLMAVAVVVVAVTVRSRLRAAAGLAALGISAALGLAAGGSYHTCYVPLPLFSRRDPAMVQRQQELLARYRDAGVIGEATYRKAVETARAGAARPTSAPDSTD